MSCRPRVDTAPSTACLCRKDPPCLWRHVLTPDEGNQVAYRSSSVRGEIAASFDCGVHLHPEPPPEALPWKGGGSAHSYLTRAQEAEIKRQNQLEYMAYDVANRLLDAQLEVVAAARRARRKRFRRYDVA